MPTIAAALFVSNADYQGARRRAFARWRGKLASVARFS
jgi:hypothetical protein